MTRGLLDTSAVIDAADKRLAAALPDEITVSTITMAELATGALLARTPTEAALRQARLQQIEATIEPLAFDVAAARSYGLVVAAVVSAGRQHRRRVADLLVAATALAQGLPLFTRNPADFAGLDGLVDVRGV